MTTRKSGWQHVGDVASALVEEIGRRSGHEVARRPDPLDRGQSHQRVFRKRKHDRPA
jgi:hypothetical protein